LFQNIKIKLNSRTWLTLKFSVVIFQALEPLQSQWPWHCLNNLSGLNDLNSLILSKNLLILMVRWSLAPKWPILVHFCGMDHQKSNFLLILALFLSEAGEDSWCYFFENWFMKLKIYDLLKPIGTITQQNYWSFDPSELIYFAFFTMRDPVWILKMEIQFTIKTI
jgi:hypothetical protein